MAGGLPAAGSWEGLRWALPTSSQRGVRRRLPGGASLFSSPPQGVCLGMQLAVVEFSRNVLGWQGKCLFKSLLNSCLHVPGGREGWCRAGHWEPWARTGLVSGCLSGPVSGTFTEERRLLRAEPQEGGSSAEAAF